MCLLHNWTNFSINGASQWKGTFDRSLITTSQLGRTHLSRNNSYTRQLLRKKKYPFALTRKGTKMTKKNQNDNDTSSFKNTY